MKDKKQRKAVITDEPMVVPAALLGKKLASPWRRGIAIGIDGSVWFFISMVILLFISWQLLKINQPELHREISYAINNNDPDSIKAPHYANLKVEIIKLMEDRKPQEISPEFREALKAGDREKLDDMLREYSVDNSLNFNTSASSGIDYKTKTITIHSDLILGNLNLGLNIGWMYILYFTVFVWITNGVTLGKWITRTRIIKLNGRKITLWDAFGRAGGYSASFATLGVGFIESFWHPNRQTVHDRISGTVVVRKETVPRKSK